MSNAAGPYDSKPSGHWLTGYVTDMELRELEHTATANGLEVISRLCAEVRLIRAEYIRQAHEIGRLRAMAGYQPHVEYVVQLSNQTGVTDVPT